LDLSFITENYVGIIALIAVVGILIAKKGKKKKKSSGGGGGNNVNTRPWIYIDDITTESNGVQDFLAMMALAKYHTLPEFAGSTYTHKSGDRVGDGVILAQKMRDAVGMDFPIFAGARAYGLSQGPSQLSKRIVETAHKYGSLDICVGGKFTDVALALKQDPTIKAKIRVYGIGTGNISKDQEAYNYIRSHGVWEMIYHNKEYLSLIWVDSTSPTNMNTVAKRERWMREHFLSTKAGQIGTNHPLGSLDEARMLNLGQVRAGSPIRIADILGILGKFYGYKRGKNQKEMWPIITEAFKTLK
jgi:hypothetical protein